MTVRSKITCRAAVFDNRRINCDINFSGICTNNSTDIERRERWWSETVVNPVWVCILKFKTPSHYTHTIHTHTHYTHTLYTHAIHTQTHTRTCTHTHHIWKALRQLLFPSATGTRHWPSAESVSVAIRPLAAVTGRLPIPSPSMPFRLGSPLTAFTVLQPEWSSRQPSVCSYTAMKHVEA